MLWRLPTLALVISKVASEWERRVSIGLILSVSLFTVRSAQRCDEARSPTRISWTSPVSVPKASKVSLPARRMPFIAGGKLVTEGGVNRTGVFDPTIDAAYSAYLSSTSPADACKNISAFQRRLLEKHYVMPMVASTTEFFSKNFTPYTVAWQILRTKS